MVWEGDFVRRVARAIARERTARGLTQEALASKLDIATKNLQRIESGKQNLTLKTIERIARELAVVPDALMASASSEAPPKASVKPKPEGLARAPLLTIRAAASAGALRGEARAVSVAAQVEIPGLRTLPHGAFVAEVHGDSMEPRIPDGSLCLFAAPRPGGIEGRVFLLEHRQLGDPLLGGPYALKRVGGVSTDERGRRQVRLTSTNPRVATIVIELEEDEELKIVAELVQVVVPGARGVPGEPGVAGGAGTGDEAEPPRRRRTRPKR